MKGLRVAVSALLLLSAMFQSHGRAFARQQPTAAAPAALRQIGTVQSITADTLALSTDKGEKVIVGLSPETRVLQLPVGSTDLKAAQPAALTDLVVGDRVLAVGSPGSAPVALLARRLVLMKSADISKQREAEQEGWQHGSGGIVSAIDLSAGAITLAAGARTVSVSTSPTTIFRRYAPTSARFEDATRSTLAELHVGDQLRVRGERGGEGAIKAEEIVSGSFRHLSGTILSLDASAHQLTVRDLKSKKPMVLLITEGTGLHKLSEEDAARFAARAKTSQAAKATPTAAESPAAGAASPSPHGGPAAHGNGGDLAQVVSRLPALPLSDFKAGEAVMVVGTDGTSGSIAALSVLGGVEPILAASPGGGAEVALSPWSMGGGEAGVASAQ